MPADPAPGTWVARRRHNQQIEILEFRKGWGWVEVASNVRAEYAALLVAAPQLVAACQAAISSGPAADAQLVAVLQGIERGTEGGPEATPRTTGSADHRTNT